MAEQEVPEQPMPQSLAAKPASYHKMKGSAGSTGLDWRAPTIMISSLVMGVAAAVGHDRFYAAYNGRPVNEGLEQKIIHNVGAAFAVVVKMFLAISTGVVFTQYLWVSLAEKPEAIDQIDGLFAVLGNALEFRRLALWFRHWLLGLLALLTWCLPIAAVFTPGTINVRTALRYDNNTLSTPVQPQQSWNRNQTYAVSVSEGGTMLVGSDGKALPFQVILDQPTSELSRVAIASASQESILPIQSGLENATYSLSFFAPALDCQPVSSDEVSIFNASLMDAYTNHWLPGATLTLNSQPNTGDFLDLSDPDWNNDTWSTSPDYNNTEYFYLPSNAESSGMILLACALHNATYEIDFNYQSFHQTVTIRSVSLGNEVTMGAAESIFGSPLLPADDYAGLVYNAILFAFNDIVIASATVSDAYASARYTGGSTYASPLRRYIEGGGNSTTAEIKRVLEELFQNITISTLSSPSFQLAEDKAVQMKITTWYSQNVYVYESTDLYIAYGSAIGCTLVCVLYGCYILLRSKVTYSTDFSTILRTTRRKQFDELVPLQARAGYAPLPRHIKTTRLIYLKDSDSGDGFALVQSLPEPENTAEPATHEYAKIGSQGVSQIWEHDSMIGDGDPGRGNLTIRR